MNTTPHQYGTFYADQFRFAISVDRVQEVLHSMPTTRVPLTTPIVDGLINLRGQIVMAIDLRTRLELPPRDPRKTNVSLIVRTNSGLICLRTDRLGDVLDCDGLDCEQQSLDAMPDTVTGPMRELVRGILKLPDYLLLVLDPDLLADSEVCLGPHASSIEDK
jgi:purine-binding chemotaxis protein CheW